ncbi:hypothetical protein NDU88_003801 [Pleurodeles waltl]|uniref:Uncharacterized protein n=1 Tax=Pleurodeles waltl TaxID=8319 RepID=A0AAV7RF97_PLEWA|nr:hypothetical protein NDU88_003801 [Pleurodeles waltl]
MPGRSIPATDTAHGTAIPPGQPIGDSSIGGRRPPYAVPSVVRPTGLPRALLLFRRPGGFWPICSAQELRTRALNPGTEGVRMVRERSPAMGGNM